jgi:predicted metal-dependent peptidase
MVSAKSVVRPRSDAYTPSALSADIKKPISEKEAVNYYYRALKDNKRSEEFNKQMAAATAGQQFGNASSNCDATPDNNQGEMPHQYEMSAEAVDEMSAKFKKITANAVEASGGMDRTRGTIPAFLAEAIAKLLAPPQIKWSEHLRQMIGTIPYGKTPTRLRLNRRQPYRADLRGHFPDRLVEIVCVFDTSGSMSAKDLATCMNEVFNITKKFRTKITVIECDMEINHVYEVSKPGDLKTEMHGRGGTCFTPAIDYINGDLEFKGKKLRKGRFKNSLMVYFTDGYGESSIPKPLTHKNLWVVMENEKNLSVKNPYGKVVSIKNKELRKHG